MESVVGVERSEYYSTIGGNLDTEFTAYEMTVFGHQVDHRIYAANEADALEEAKGKFARAIGQVLKVESQLAAMEYDEEEY